MTARRIRPPTTVAIILALTAALIARSWLQLHLLHRGLTADLAADLSYLLVPPILMLLLFPLWKTQKDFLIDQFRLDAVSPGLILRALAIGLLIRVLWWCQLVAGISFGFYRTTAPDATVGPVFSFQCAGPGAIALGFLVMAILVPIIEETVHRGYVQTTLQKRGAFAAIFVSALAFAVFHRVGSWPFVFLAGVVLGIQYWVTRSLWSSLVSHATINGLIQFDWRCLSGQWNPASAEIPVLGPGFVASVILVCGFFALLYLLRKTATEAPVAPR